MLNNYTTDEYLTDVLRQYQLKSPIRRAVTPQVVANSTTVGGVYTDQQLMDDQYFSHEELKRRQMNESLFKTVDRQLFGGQTYPTASGASTSRRTETPAPVVRPIVMTNPNTARLTSNPVITSDSFLRPEPPPASRSSYWTQSNGSAARSTYYGQTIGPKTRGPSRQLSGYKAKVIDYSLGGTGGASRRPSMASQRYITGGQQQQPPAEDEVKRAVARSVADLQSAIALMSQQLTTSAPPAQMGPPAAHRLQPKPILKKPSVTEFRRLTANSGFNGAVGNGQTTSKPLTHEFYRQTNPSFDRLTQSTANRLLTAAKQRMIASKPAAGAQLTSRSYFNPQPLINRQLLRQPTGTRPKPIGFNNHITPPIGVTQFSDKLMPEFENIFKTMDGQQVVYYCPYCDIYIHDIQMVELHCINDTNHIQNRAKSGQNSLLCPLNEKLLSNQLRRFSQRTIAGDAVIGHELQRIPFRFKHYLFINGIRLANPGGGLPYHCQHCDRFFESTIESIKRHLESGLHRRLALVNKTVPDRKRRPTPNRNILSQSMVRKLKPQPMPTGEPVTGLEFITQYTVRAANQMAYQCQVCQYSLANLHPHVTTFRHRIQVLKALNPNERTLDSIRDTPRAAQEIRKRVAELQRIRGTGKPRTVNGRPPSMMISEPIKPVDTFEVMDTSDDDDCMVIEGDDEVVQESFGDLYNACYFRVTNDTEARDTDAVIMALKESIVNYFLNKIPTNMRNILVNKVVTG